MTMTVGHFLPGMMSVLFSGSVPAAEPVAGTLTFGGLQRSYVLHVPARLQTKEAPLVVVLHGLGGDGTDALRQGRWIERADSEGFVLIAPEGLPEKPDRPASFFGNRRNWNAGPATGSPAAERGVDDVGFIRSLIGEMRRTHRVDPRRIYVTGFSNGAGMAFRIGAELSDLVAAIAPVANGLLLPVEKLKHPVSLLLIWGRDDPLNPIHGGVVSRGGRGTVRPSAEDSWRRWAALLHCSGEPVVDRSVPRVTRRSFTGGSGNAAAVLVEVAGLGHQWPGGKVALRLLSGPGSDALDATAEIWTFFSRISRSE